MELSSSIVNTLKAIGDQKFSNDTYSILVKSLFDSFVININHELDISLDSSNIDSIKTNTNGELKDATASLYTLIIEFAKHNYSPDAVSAYLDEIGFPNDKIKLFLQYYSEKKSLIRAFLLNLTTSHAHIVDVSWRLDYCVKENNMERINEPIYLIELKVEKPGEDKLSKIQFSCSVEQLQDLVYKLKEACKSLEKLTGSTKD